MNCTITFYIEETLIRLLTFHCHSYSHSTCVATQFHFYGYPQSTYMAPHITLLRLPTIHFYGSSHCTSTATRNPLLLLLTFHLYGYQLLLTFHFYGYSYSTSTATRIPLLRLPTFHLYGYPHSTLWLLTFHFYGHPQSTSRLPTFHSMATHIPLYDYSHSTSTVTHSPLLRLLQYNSSTSTHNSRLLRLLTINFYGYLQYISSTTTNNTLLPRLPTTISTTIHIPRLLWLLKSTSCVATHSPLQRLLTIHLYGYSQPPS
jgi:hypothetical protein